MLAIDFSSLPLLKTLSSGLKSGKPKSQSKAPDFANGRCLIQAMLCSAEQCIK